MGQEGTAERHVCACRRSALRERGAGRDLCAVGDGLPHDVVVAELACEPHALVELVDGERAGVGDTAACCGSGGRGWRGGRGSLLMRLAEVMHAVSNEGSIRVFEGDAALSAEPNVHFLGELGEFFAAVGVYVAPRE